jgi:sec-independent protein translocase protein TatB
MFDIGFFEIVFIMVIALLVVGPERLPRIARTAGLWLGKMRGFVASVKADIDREVAAEDLRKTLAKHTAVPEIEELIDTISGDPLKAVESTVSEAGGKKQTAEKPAVPGPGQKPDDKQQ